MTTEDPPLGRRVPGRTAAPGSPRALVSNGWLRTRGLPGALAAVFTVLAWPLVGLTPGGGLDPSHEAAMHMASRGGLQFGTQLLFTYGPLGFLASPALYYSRTALLAAAFVLAVEAGALYLLARSFLRALPPLAAFAAMWLVSVAAISSMTAGAVSELLALLVALLALEWIELGPDSRWDPLVPAALAALGSVALLVKFSAGVVALAAVALACVVRTVHDGAGWRPDLRGAAAGLGSAAAGALGSLVVCWVAAGESLGHLVAFLRGSLEIASGYSAAMNIEDPARAWEYGAAALAVACVLIALPASRRGGGLRERFALPAVIALVTFGMFKEGFTRHDLHSAIFFSALLVLSSALWARVSRPVMLTLLAFLLSLSLAVNNLSISGVLAMRDGPRRAWESLSTLVSGGRRAGVETASRSELRARYGLSGQQLALLAGHTVHVDPWEASLAWAYPELRWDPAPVFQTYSAYTQYLDDVNAGFLASGRAPDFILRHADAIDGRDPRWESPRYMLEMLCRYQQVGSGNWQVLQRIPSRCGSPVTSSPVRTTLGATVSAPPPGAQSIVAVRLASWGRPLGERLRTLLYKGNQYYVTYANGPTSRFIPGDAGSWHVVAAPSCLEWDASAFPRTGSSLRFDLGQPPVASAKPVTVQFVEIPFTCP